MAMALPVVIAAVDLGPQTPRVLYHAAGFARLLDLKLRVISRCAATEGAGLVVMGLRNRPRCQPGSIATAVMKTGKAFVLAVPGC